MSNKDSFKLTNAKNAFLEKHYPVLDIKHERLLNKLESILQFTHTKYPDLYNDLRENCFPELIIKEKFQKIKHERFTFLGKFPENVRKAYSASEKKLLSLLIFSEFEQVYQLRDFGNNISPKLILSLACRHEKNNPDFKEGYWKNKNGEETTFAEMFNTLNRNYQLKLNGLGLDAEIKRIC